MGNNQWSGSHGHAARGALSGAYSSWVAMKSRCKSGKLKSKSYLAKGIKVCDRWSTFENFLADMGERPEGTSIDRIDNNLGYEPGNCRWATLEVQVLNSTRWRDVTGSTFGRLTVMRMDLSCYPKLGKWICRCICGNTKLVKTSHLTCGNISSCGCYKTEVMRINGRKYGGSNKKPETRTMAANRGTYEL